MYEVLPEYVLGVGLAVVLVHTCESAIAGGDALALQEHRSLVRGFSMIVREDAVREVYEAHSVVSAITHLFCSRIDCTSSICEIYYCNYTTPCARDDWNALAGVNPNASVSQGLNPR